MQLIPPKLLPFATPCIVGYVIAYSLLLQPKEQFLFANLNIAYWERRPSYRIGGEFVQRLFGPVNRLDLMLRPSYWHWSNKVHVPDLGVPISNKSGRQGVRNYD